MDMIKKIALTASTMLFVLAQIFSFYVILGSQQEKIMLVKEKEEELIRDCVSAFDKKRGRLRYDHGMSDYILTQCFRETMPENSAFYRGGTELFNNSHYEFEIDAAKSGGGDRYGISCVPKKIGDARLLVFYQVTEEKKQEYTVCHVLDITYIYRKGWELAGREFLISLLLSGMMAVLLVVLIKRITKPLEDANEAQRKQIGSLSHELKTPLTAIKGYSETLLNVRISEEQMQKALHYIYTESGRLSRLSEKMMELTRLYEPECQITLEPVEITVLFEAVEDSVRYRLEEEQIQLVREGDLNGLVHNLDRDLMTSFLINLINNGITASKPGSRMFLGADKHGFWVQDEGCGIPPGEVEKVREAFYRVDKSRSRKSGNMGLGLAICNQIAEVHHAKMQIESEAGIGTKISFLL